ncbi:hypothetical protein ACFL21_00420 [Patescibacteria group bacterium]
MQTIKYIIKYVLTKNPGSEFNYYLEIGILSAILISGGIIFGMIYKRRKKHDFAFKKLFKRVSKFAVYLGLAYGILLLIRYEQIPYFSMRLWLFITSILLAWFIFRFLRIFITVYPKEKANINRNKKVKKVEKYSTKKRRN